MRNINYFDVSKEIVVISGVCGQLGHSYARAFLNAGANVIGLDLEQSAENMNLESSSKEHYVFCKADVTNKTSLKSALKVAESTFGTPTVLINNAAIDSPPSSSMAENGPFEDYPEETWKKVMDVNVTGVYLCCQVFGTAMALENKGSIVNISSIYGILSPDQSLYNYRRDRGEVFYKPIAYSVSKSALLNLTRYLAVYWAKKQVRVNTLTISGVYNHQEKPFMDSYCNRIPIGRMADSQEYNGALLFLASNASSYMTGSNLIIDGGWSAI
jgi:NAD(P)-dependent dehydrogenase (short-subunit alcohol dehydrogenase family)